MSNSTAFAFTLLLAIGFYVLVCTDARAQDSAVLIEHEIAFFNRSEVKTNAFRLCDVEKGQCWTSAVDCEPETVCKVKLMLPEGRFPAVANVSTEGVEGAMSPDSNQVTVTIPRAERCLSNPVCRLDLDGDHRVGGSDFWEFVKLFGSAWE